MIQKPTLQSLCTPDRLTAIPEGLPESVTPPKGHHGLCVGRKDELKRIHDYFATQWQSETEGRLADDDCVACIISNAPGAGKTTLREQFGIDVVEQGRAWIELGPAAMATDNEIAEAIVEYASLEPPEDVPGKSKGEGIRRKLAERWNQLLAGLQRHRSALVGAAVGTAGSLGTGLPVGALAGTLTTIGLQRKDNLAEEILKQIETLKRPPTTKEALQALTRSFEGRYVLTVDEAHEWQEARLDRGALHRNLDIICSPSLRKRAGIRGGGLLISGLGDVGDHVDGLGLSRAGRVWTVELSEDDAMRVIAHEMGNPAEYVTDEAARDLIIATWPSTLAGTFTGWPQHAGTAGRMAQTMLRAGALERASSPNDVLGWVQTRTAEAIQDLYGTQVEKGELLGDREAVPLIAAWAQRTHGEFERDDIFTIVEHCLRGTPDPDGRLVAGKLSGLKRAGILRDHRETREDGFIVKTFRMGIPSLVDYIHGIKGEAAMAKHYATLDRLFGPDS